MNGKRGGYLGNVLADMEREPNALGADGGILGYRKAYCKGKVTCRKRITDLIGNVINIERCFFCYKVLDFLIIGGGVHFAARCAVLCYGDRRKAVWGEGNAVCTRD